MAETQDLQQVIDTVARMSAEGWGAIAHAVYQQELAVLPKDPVGTLACGYWIWETEGFEATEEEAQEIAALVLGEVVRVLAYPMYGVTRQERELFELVRGADGSVALVDGYRTAIEDATARIAVEVVPLMASREEAILSSLGVGDRWAITAVFGEALALALTGVDRWYPARAA